jgi:hypothetical protein
MLKDVDVTARVLVHGDLSECAFASHHRRKLANRGIP